LALIEDAKTSDALGKLTRYETSLINSLKKILKNARGYTSSVDPVDAIRSCGVMPS
jgi:hypothetical protein